MDVKQLVEAFERIHPSARRLQFVAKGGKAAHWRTLNTIPEEGSGLISVPLVYLELGSGTADALGNFFLTAMQFARDASAT